METAQINILVIEDNPADAELVTEVLGEQIPHAHMHVARDGEEGIDYLYQRNMHSDAPRPDFVLLDLNLPKRSGLEILQAMKGDPALRLMPIIVFTSSEAPRDIEKCYCLSANCYITKPSDLDLFTDKMKMVANFWCQMAQLPDKTMCCQI